MPLEVRDGDGVFDVVPDSEEEVAEAEAGARSLQAHTFLSWEEKSKLLRLARKAGLSQSAYLRMLVNEQPDIAV